MLGRDDRKAKVSPFVPLWVHEQVHEIARFHENDSYRLPRDGETARSLVLAAFHDDVIINHLSPYFWRSYERNERFWPGHNKHDDLKKIISFPGEPVRRMHMRFSKQEVWEIGELQSALAVPFAHTVCALLLIALNQNRIIEVAKTC